MAPRAAFIALLIEAVGARRHDFSARTANRPSALLEDKASSDFPVNQVIAPMIAAVGAMQPGAVPTARHVAISATASQVVEGGADDSEMTRVAPKRPRHTEMAPLKASSPLLVDVPVKGKWTQQEIVVPKEWAGKLDTGSVVVGKRDETMPSYYTASANMLAAPGVKVQLSAAPADAPGTLRALLVSQLLSQTGSVPTFFERQHYPDATFMLTEDVGNRKLEALIAERSPPADSGPAVPLEQSLPLMIDLLRVLESMEHLRIVHCGLSEANIHLVDGDKHAVVTGLHDACLQDSMDARLRCSGVMHAPAGAEFRQAPETPAGRAGGVPSNVWQAGLVFARMLFGGEVVTEAVVLKHMRPQDIAKLANSAWRAKDGDDESDSAWEVQEEMRKIIKQHFSIREVEGFQRLGEKYADVLEVLEGMLQKRPDDRWSAERARGAMELIALERGVAVPSPRAQAVLPEDFNEDWQ